ncbi:uncharacterized protein K452DRAFT_281120 [Aplosporella prunicola CBS 121167]|uniref:Non-reducing end beta-L-arabinofuranosidase-like GH127 catalytic domain-containing protein n=1 Tax=Aplosporella prunicola CBS 121167 TaxID=1176127 RepID=A0A6A6AZ16_9PEZI|nr:uncharacterized protein K452DRAFT_281120 [Aplosporella prunicola CBS 121167]KAF2135711.1 hypothetical protein K452DRAFT_281120 [Aplosporella prunicola CBS 121167]
MASIFNILTRGGSSSSSSKPTNKPTPSPPSPPHPLVPLTYPPFLAARPQPAGWLRTQLRLGARGQAGALGKFYRFVVQSSWVLGEGAPEAHEYSALNEAAPYWYRSVVMLAAALGTEEDDEDAQELWRQANAFVDHVLRTQADDGWLGPERSRQTRGIWARCLLLQGMVVHARADATREEAIRGAIARFVKLVREMLQRGWEGYLPDEAEGDVFDPQLFGVARAHELATVLEPLFQEGPDGSDEGRDMWDVMEMMWEGGRVGERDWTGFLSESGFLKTPAVKGEVSNFCHGVNVAQGLRYPAQLYRMHPTPTLLEQSKRAADLVFTHHGTAAGSMASDEYLGGLAPTRGSETCCTVELIFSLTYLYTLFGESELAERAEKAAFNALPAALSEDWWAHQYVCQVNQPWAKQLEVPDGERRPWYDVCVYANVFGLEPEYPCCTVNHPIGYPSLLANAFLRVPQQYDDGILHAHILPSRLTTPDAITIDAQTNYPFVPAALLYTITTPKPLTFYIRVPTSIDHATSTIAVRGPHTQTENEQPFAPNFHAGLHRIPLPAAGTYTIAATLRAEPRAETHPDGSVSVHCGPLLYAHAVPYTTTTRPPRDFKDQERDCPDFAAASIASEAGKNKNDDEEPWKSHIRDHFLVPQTPDWGLAIDPSQPLTLRAPDPWLDKAHTRTPWAPDAAPTAVEVSGVQVPWPLKGGTAAEPGEVDTSDEGAWGARGRVRLVPFATARVRVAQFPVVRLGEGEGGDKEKEEKVGKAGRCVCM